METERIALSQRERDRLRVLHEVKQKQITQIAAAKRLKISDRHIRRPGASRAMHTDGWIQNGGWRKLHQDRILDANVLTGDSTSPVRPLAAW